MSKGWEWLGANNDQVTIVFALIAGLYVLFEYQANEADTRVNRSLELQARYSQSELLAARQQLEAFWLSEESKQALDQAPGDAAEKITFVVRARKLDPHVFLLADFLGQVALCVKSDLCDAKTACDAFRGPVVALHNTYFDLFKRWQERWGENLIAETYQLFNATCARPRSAGGGP
jgi:hypothetical protein